MPYMKISNENTSRIVSDLMKNSLEMLKFYEKINSIVDDESLRQIFMFYIGKRKEMVNELKSEIDKINSKETFADLIESFFNKENNHSAALVKEDIKMILTECEKNENESVKIYESAVKEDVSPKLRSLISKQFGEIKEAHYHMKLLRDCRLN